MRGALAKYYVKIHWQGFRMSRLLIVLFAFLVGAVAGGYWGEHYSHTAIALQAYASDYLPFRTARHADEGVSAGLS
jgi:hypothetical protein